MRSTSSSAADGIYSRDRIRRLADHLRRARAVLHEGRMGTGCLRLAGASPFDPPRIKALSRCRRFRSSPRGCSPNEARGSWDGTPSPRRWPSSPNPTAAAAHVCTAGSARASAARQEPNRAPGDRHSRGRTDRPAARSAQGATFERSKSTRRVWLLASPTSMREAASTFKAQRLWC